MVEESWFSCGSQKVEDSQTKAMKNNILHTTLTYLPLVITTHLLTTRSAPKLSMNQSMSVYYTQDTVLVQKPKLDFWGTFKYNHITV